MIVTQSAELAVCESMVGYCDATRLTNVKDQSGPSREIYLWRVAPSVVASTRYKAGVLRDLEWLFILIWCHEAGRAVGEVLTADYKEAYSASVINFRGFSPTLIYGRLAPV